MEKIISLIKTDFNTTFGLSSIAYNFRNRKNRWQVIVFGLAMLLFLPGYLLFVGTLYNIYEICSQIGQRPMFLLAGFLASQMIVFVLGLLYVMSKYYFSSDLALLVPLPIKPSYILGSKFATLMVSEYLTSLPIIVPFILIYGIRGGEGIAYWIYSFLLIATLPVIPLVLASVLVMFFMKYTNIGGKKDLVRTLGSVLFLVLMIYIQVKINTETQKSLVQGKDFLLNLVKDSNLLVKNLGLKFPPSMWASLSLSNYSNIKGLAYLLLFIGAGILSFVIMIFLSENLFFGGLIGNIEVSASKSGGRTGRKLSLGRSTGQMKPYLALAKKEVMMLFKTPIYLFNSIGGAILVPIIMGISIMSGGEESMGLIIKFIETEPKFIALAGIGFLTLMGMLNSVGVTTFSREGKNFWIQRVLPIRARDQIIGRVLASIAVQVLGLIVLLAVLAFFVKLKISTVILITVLGILGSIPMTQLGMVIDIIRPMLVWTNPQQAMKQNLNVLFGMGAGTLYAGGMGYLVFKLADRVDMNLIFIGLAVIFVISAIILYYILEKLIKRQFKILE